MTINLFPLTIFYALVIVFCVGAISYLLYQKHHRGHR